MKTVNLATELVCQRCRHSEVAHERNGGSCHYIDYSEQRIETDEGIEIQQDWTCCDCLYLLASS